MKQVIPVCALALSLGGCAGITQLQDSISKFDQSAHTISTNQTQLFSNITALDCNTQFYISAYNWSYNKIDKFDVTSACQPAILTADQVKLRSNLMATIALYADKLAALSSADRNKDLDANTQTLASNLNSLAKQGGLRDPSIAAGVEAAVIGLTDMVLDQRRYTDVKAAAAAMDPQISTVVESLKAENIQLGQAIPAQYSTLDLNLRSVVGTAAAQARASKDPADPSHAAAFLALVQAHQIYSTFGPSTLIPGASGVPSYDVKALNESLDALVKANHAIATAGSGGVVAAVSDLVARAKAAQAIQTALAK